MAFYNNDDYDEDDDYDEEEEDGDPRRLSGAINPFSGSGSGGGLPGSSGSRFGGGGSGTSESSSGSGSGTGGSRFGGGGSGSTSGSGSGSGGSSGDSGSRFGGSGSGTSGSSSGSGSGSSPSPFGGGGAGGSRFGGGGSGSTSGSGSGSGSGGTSGDSGSSFGGGSGGTSGSGSGTGGSRFGGGGGTGGSSGSGSGGTSGSGSGGTSGSGSGTGGSRFGGGTGGSSGSGSGGTSGSGSGGTSGSGSGTGGSRFGGGGGGGTGGSSGSGSGGTSGSGSGTGGSRFGGGGGTGGSSGSGSGGSSGDSGSRFGGGGSGGTSGGTSGSGSGGSFGGTRPSTSTSTGTVPAVKPDDKKDDKGGGRNIFGRGGGDDKKDDKSKNADADKKGGAGGFLNRGKKEDEGKKPDVKAQTASKNADADKKGALGGLASRFGLGGGDKPKEGDKKSSDSKSSSPSPSPFGAKSGGVGSATKTDAGKTPAKGKAVASADTGGVLGNLRSRIPFLGGAAETKKAPASKTRANKVPQPVNEGLSLDQKLDILGVALMFSAVAIFFSSLSGQQGSLTGTINNFFSQLVGQGSVVVPLVFGGAGFWLIIRHFGEEAPRIDPVRVSGLVMLFIGGLMLLMFIETFSYTTATAETFPLYIEQSIAQGRGGGQVGAYLYNLLVVNLGELPAVVFVFGWLVVGVMVLTRTSAAELTVYIMSIWRSLRVAGQRRSQKRTAMRTALLEARAKEASEREKAKPVITKPQPAELSPAPVMGVLPETTPTAESLRAIPIRMGNQTVTAEVDAEGNITAPQPPKPMDMPNTPVGVPVAQSVEKTDAGAKPRFLPSFGRSKTSTGTESTEKVANAKPVEQPTAENKPDTTEKAGGFNRFRRNTPANNSPEDMLTAKPPTATTPTPSPDVLPKPPLRASAKATTTGEVSTLKPPVNYDMDDDDDEVEETPKRIPLMPMGEPTSRFGSQSSTPPPSTTSETSPRFGGSSGGTVSPFGKPSTSTPPSSSPLGGFKPAPMPPIRDEDDDEDDDESVSTAFMVDDDIFGRLESNKPADMPSTISTPASTPPTSPFGAPPPRFGGSSASPFGTPSSKPPLSADDDEDSDDDEDEKPSDRNSRLDQIRTGNINKPTAFTRPSATLPVDDDEDDDDEDDYDEDDEDDVTSVARKPMGNPFGDNKPTPFGASPTPTPAPKPFSPFGKPEDKAGSMGDVTRTPSFTPPTFAASTQPKQTEVPEPTTLNKPPIFASGASNSGSGSGASAEKPTSTFGSSAPKKVWRLPDYRTLLASGSEGDIDREQLVRRAKMIEETLGSFGAPGRVVEINTGPVITQFGIEPDYLTVRGGKKVRVKVGQIAQLDKDIQLALGAKSIRIEAPVPGKGYVGIEVPNEEAALVSLRDVMESKQFNKLGEKSPLTIALGQSVDGAPISADLASMPHLLIAGTTGSGKSVCVNAIIASILVRNTPDKVKFIMVDPKRVELTGYNGIPHLIAPVVVELERIVGVLKWVTREMDDRYKKFSNAGARNIEDYNQHAEGVEPLPYIIVIIDELADLMMLAPDETERVITRIAALARATGIHLVIATQRPSVDVVTGLIKANFPARIAFAVAGGVDSRVILDQPGAEKLLGRGDMLYLSGDSPSALRLQGVYVSDMEINNINRFWRTQQPDAVAQKSINALVGEESPTVTTNKGNIPINKLDAPPRVHSSTPTSWDEETSPSNPNNHSAGFGSGSRDENAHEDELYEEAVEMVRRLNKASVSLLQRRLRIGYTRAARLIDIMEAQGVVGPATEGSKPREVIPPAK